jgi:hypothetical protein
VENPSELEVIEDPIVTPRAREVWMPDRQKILNRAVRLLLSEGLIVELWCADEDCDDRKVKREATGGGFDLLCGCKRRVFTRPTQETMRQYVARQ